jgi:outer membrane protein
MRWGKYTRRNKVRHIILLMILPFLVSDITVAKNAIHLTLESAVDIAINNSYRTRELELELKRSVHYLNAYKAGLHTQVYMHLKTPDFSNLSDYRWNSTLYKDEIVRINSTLWQSDLSVLQPVILFGYPTNGYLSLNYRVYNYQQYDEGNKEIDWYNRLYLKFEQPIFLPNELKNDLEEAELDLQDIKIRYIADRLEIIEDIADDYFDIFELMYAQKIHQNHLFLLQGTLDRCNKLVAEDSSRHLEMTQIKLEMSNVVESQLSNQAQVRNDLANLRQRLRLSQNDSLYVIPALNIIPINVQLDQALQLALKNTLQLQRLHLSRRRSEIDVENEKGRNAFHMTIEATYGLEKKNHQFNYLWNQFDNSNSLTLNAYLPIWDGGQRRNRIEAELLDIDRRDLNIEQEREDIINDVTNFYTNLNEFYNRTLNMQNSVSLSKTLTSESIKQYGRGEISLQALIQIINRHKETEEKFLQVYSSYRRSMLELSLQTLHDFETNRSLLEQFELAYEER